MDGAALDAVQEQLVAWGLLEPGPQGLAWSRRFRAAVMREAARLAEEERAGRKPPGHPLENAVAGALRGAELPPGAAHSKVHERYLVAVELAALPEAVKAFWER
jgi:hypothetical protein